MRASMMGVLRNSGGKEFPDIPGALAYSSKTTPPVGYLLCDGSVVSRTTYADLFAAIGTRYGVGDGSTTFGIPNVSGYFARFHDPSGANDPSRGSDPLGSKIGTNIQTDQNKSHSHPQRSGNLGGGGCLAGTILTNGNYSGYSGYSVETRPKNINSLCMIRYAI